MVIIKINLKILRATLENCKEVIISNVIEKIMKKGLEMGTTAY